MADKVHHSAIFCRSSEKARLASRPRIGIVPRIVKTDGIVTQTLAAPFAKQPIRDGSCAQANLLGPAYCISLASQVQRRAFCQKQFGTEGVDVTFVDGIVPGDKARFPTLGARGCFLSHLKVLETALAEHSATGARYVTIFEDDVLLPRSFASIVSDVMRQLRGIDWHIFYWGTDNHPPTTPVPGREPLATIAPGQTITGKQAYTIRLESAPALIDHLRLGERQPLPGYSDGMYHEFRMKYGLPAYTHTLQPARQASFASNITPRRFNWARQPLRAVKRQLQSWTR